MKKIECGSNIDSYLFTVAVIEQKISDLYSRMEKAEFLYGLDSDEYNELLQNFQLELSNENYYVSEIPSSIIISDSVTNSFSLLGCSRLVERIKTSSKYELERFKSISISNRTDIVNGACAMLGVDTLNLSESIIDSIINSAIKDKENDLSIQDYFLFLLENNRLSILQDEIDKEMDEEKKKTLLGVKYSLLQNSAMAEKVNFGLLSDEELKTMNAKFLALKNNTDICTIINLKNEYFKNATQDIVENLLEDFSINRNIDLLSEVCIRANLMELDEESLGTIRLFVELIVPSESQLRTDLDSIFDDLDSDKKNGEISKRKIFNPNND